MGSPSLTEKIPPLNVPFVSQPNEYTCVPACLKMVLDYVRQVLHETAPEMPNFETGEIAKIVGTLHNGTTLPNVLKINRALRRSIPSVEFSVDFNPHDFTEIVEELRVSRPVMPWLLRREGERAYEHVVVVTGYDPVEQLVAVNDPQGGIPSAIGVTEFMDQWEGADRILIKLKVNQKIQRLITDWVEETARKVEAVEVASA